MIYQVIATLFFAEEDEGKDFYLDCEIALTKATFINPGQPNLEYSLIELIKCYHDEQPVKPCQLIFSADNKPPVP